MASEKGEAGVQDPSRTPSRTVVEASENLLEPYAFSITYKCFGNLPSAASRIEQVVWVYRVSPNFGR